MKKEVDVDQQAPKSENGAWAPMLTGIRFDLFPYILRLLKGENWSYLVSEKISKRV